MTHKIGFVQPNFRFGPKTANAFYLPYSMGVLWAYASRDQTVMDNFSPGHIVFRRDPVESIAKILSQHDVLAFSTYVWNRNYNYALARRVKELNPQCLTIFGGPEVAIERKDLFEQHPFMDLVVKLEGEETFLKILSSYASDYRHIPGLLINDGGLVVDTGSSTRIERLDDIPSPYLTGFFDQLIRDHPEIEWSATLETNRGCPFQCTFCDWGSLTYNKVKKFNLEKVFAELEWVSNNHCGALYIADANFGMFIERDSLIIDKIIDSVKTTGWPKVFNLTWAKNKKEDVVGMAKKWIDAKIRAPALTASVQTLNDNVLTIIKRKNMEMNKIEELFHLCEKEQVPVNTELILGLPGETLYTWKNNFWRLFEAGNHHGIDIYQSQLLENAEMNLRQREQYRLESALVYDYLSNSGDEDIPEGVRVVISTSTLPADEMLDAQVFNWFIYTFHLSGTTSYISRFLRKYADISYQQFYEGLYGLVKNDPWFKQEQTDIRSYFNKWTQEGAINHPGVNNINIFGWNLMQTTRMKMYAEKKYDSTFELVKEYLYTFNLPALLVDELIELQRLRVCEYDKIPLYPIVRKFNHDILGYLLEDKDLYKTVDISFDYPSDEDPTVDFSTFIELIWYGRRREFGLTKLTVTARSEI